jgi:23S rRNA (uridine2479-2'-O)-methyltransferase
MPNNQRHSAHVLRVSSRNQWFQRVVTLKTNRKKRWHHGQFVVEGVRSINQLRGNDRWQVAAFLYAHGECLSDWADDVLDTVPAAHHLEVDPALMAELSDKEETSELIGVVDMPQVDGRQLALSNHDVALVLDRPSNPGNLGSIIRSCDAFGVRGVVIVGHGVDPFDPVVVRASAGSFFSVDISRLQSKAGLQEWIARVKEGLPELQVMGTSADGTMAPWECDLSRPTILAMGNETRGLSAWLKELCDGLLRIDMQGAASSLNLACATTTFLYEAHRQRGEVT